VPDTSSTTPIAHFPKPDHDVSISNLKAAHKEIAAIIGDENINHRLDEIERHTGSEWSSHPGSTDEAPAAIVMPASTEEVSKIMKICHKRRIPVVAFSGGTSLEGHFANTRRGICIDFGRMNQVLQVHKDDLDVVVQPAVGYGELNDLLAEQASLLEDIG
jgi:D-lactate dehydrogenase (cytochrome)